MKSFIFILLLYLSVFVYAQTINLFNSNDLGTVIGQVETIQTAQTGAQHYNFFSASGHPSGVNLGSRFSNIWIHENTNTSEFSFGFIFSRDNGNVSNSASFRFRIVGSDTNPFVSISDDAGEAVETPSGSNAFRGTFNYGNNSDGVMISGITGNNWTVIIDSVDFGNVTNWFLANGEQSGFSDDINLTLGQEFRLTAASLPSNENVDPEQPPLNPIPEPANFLAFLFAAFLISIYKHKR